jgi:LacI family transcriptional regulator
MTRRATAQDVADLAGVSRSAVSLVLNGRADGNISRVKQEAVRSAAEQLRYTPNAVALSLRSQRTKTIGVLFWSNRSRLPLALLGAIYTSASAAGYLLLTVDALGRPGQVEALLDRRVVAPELTDLALPESVAAAPTVMVNCLDPSLTASSLVPDELGAGASAAQHLLDAGHRELAVLAGTEGLASERRVHGASQAVQAAGLPGPVVLRTGGAVNDGYAGARRLLTSGRRPSAIVCTHERLALGALLAAADLGLHVPTDLSLVSLDDGENLAGQLVPPLDHVERPDAVIAAHALEVLVDQLRHGRSAVRRLTFVCPLRPGASVAPPRLRALDAS